MLLHILLTTVLLFGAQAQAAAASLEGYAVDQTSGFRTDRYRAPVPADIPGGITLDNDGMKAVHGTGQAILIDVYPPTGLGPDPLDGHWVTSEKRESIPGTVWLPEVGRGTLTDEAHDYFTRNLSRLADGLKDKPIVFYCTADCWQSWNAARRAILWGYTAVHWYPLGTNGWLESGGSLVPVQPVNFFDDTTPVVNSAADQTSEQTQQEPDAEQSVVFPDSATIFLIDQSGQELDIGKVYFSSSDQQASGVSVEMNDDRYVDQFLSMRPFKCLTRPSEWFCHLPYPYELKNTITAYDLTDLEYQLLFIWKSPKDFGIDAWNGVYYKLALEDDGTISGQLLQGDLNVLANPPEPYSYPIDLSEFISQGAKSRLYPSLIIRP